MDDQLQSLPPADQSSVPPDEMPSEGTPFTMVSSSAAGTVAELTTSVSRPPKLMEDFTRRYFHASRIVYMLAAYVTPKLKVGWAVFSSAMYYAHVFWRQHGTVRYDPMLLATAALFLASKVEHFRVKLSKLIAVALDAAEGSPEHEMRRSQVVTMELMLAHTLNFSFLVIHPIMVIHEIAPPDTVVGKTANKLYSYTCVAPVQLHLKHRDLAVALVWIVAEGLGHLAAFEPQLTGLSEETRDQVADAVCDILYLMQKRCNVPTIDERVDLMRRTRRTVMAGTPTPAPIATNTPFPSL